jgi:uncharacterized protein (DUF2252 family)
MSFDWLAEWKPSDDRDPLRIIDEAAQGRDQRLVERRERIMADGGAFTFYRGAAGVMAADLGPLKPHTTGFEVDILGDAHIGNFGMYGSPERSRVFDVNDFDEAARGPWEWDVVRLATSAVVMERDRGSDADQQRATAEAAVTAYVQTAAALAEGPLIDRWYTMTRCDEPGCRDIALDVKGSEKTLKRVKQMLRADPKRTQAETVAKFTREGRFITVKDKVAPIDGDRARKVRATFEDYETTVEPGLQRLLHGYTPSAVARVFAGQGSLGVRNFLMLLTGRRHDDALILQLKEATTSALGYGGIEVTGAPHEGERVVGLQQALQAVSDPLLGWTSIGDEQYYVRQWRDMKSSPALTDKRFNRKDREAYARLCGTTLARAHSRTIEGDGITPISESIGDGTVFAKAVLKFARTYADVNQDDQRLLRERL